EWNGNKTVQLLLEDMAIDTWQLFDYRSKQQQKFFNPYFKKFNKHLMIGNNKEQMESLQPNNTTEIMTYDEDILAFKETDILYICDLPENLEQLKDIINKTKPLM